MTREFLVLGSGSNMPTRQRNHNGYVLRWDAQTILFDPGEGTQRQFTFAKSSASRITNICITHFHGDHCLGLPGIIQRLNGEQVTREIPIYYPADGQEYFDRLRYASAYHEETPIEPKPVSVNGPQGTVGNLTLSAAELDHRITSYGYRLQEPDGIRFVPEQLEARNVSGPDVGRLKEQGFLETPDGTVQLDEVTEFKKGQSFAIVMDTRMCDGALELADGVDTLVCESTFLTPEAHLAEEYAHMTAAQAAQLAADAGVGQLVLTHFSARYPSSEVFVEEAQPIFDNVVAVNDFDRVQLEHRG